MIPRILAVDFGSKRVGLALSDPLGIMAQPLPFIPYANRERFISDLKKMIRERSVGLILMGVPRSLDGTLGREAIEIQKLSDRIRKECRIEVRLHDESFTTRAAEEILIKEFDLSRKKRKNVRDSLAACLILKSYMESGPAKSGSSA
jgi:putative Holliday junction resolvase